jgi:glycerophosphoryl diester phosphodiesterase
MPGRLVLPRPRSGSPFLVAAHRGNRIHCPENSLAGFRRAIDDGADLLEADLRPTADGRFICFHDSMLERTSDGRGEVERRSLRELAALHLRMGDRLWPSEHIPSLEVKSHQFRKGTTCAALLSALERAGMRQRVIFLSFHARHLNVMATVAPDIPSGIVTFRPWPHGHFDLLGPVMIALRLNPRYVRSAHRRGQVVCPLDATPDARLHLYRQLGVDAVLSDDAGKTVSAALQLR